MRLQGIKARLTIIVVSLLLVSMLLVNFVLIIFWQRDAFRRELERDQAVLAHVLNRLPEDISALKNASKDYFSFADFYPQKEKGSIYLYTGNRRSVIEAVSNLETPLIAPALVETVFSGTPVVKYSGSFLGRIRSRNHLIVVAGPIVRHGTIVGGVGISRSLEPMFNVLWQTEKTVLVYILINMLIFSVIGFFRMRNVVVRPIERLVKLADQYKDQQTFLFAADSPIDEFGQLSTSLNSMLTKIEQDRQSLEKTVDELGAANLKLKTQQQEMIRTEKLASVGRLAAGLAHEIGNPLGIVQGYLGLLERSADQTDEHRDFINRADKELQRVNTLIRQLLDFARLSRGEPDNFSVHELLRSVVDMVQMQPVFSNITITCHLNADKDAVFGDQDQLRQVFVNCLLNSADAVSGAGRGDDGVITLTTDVTGLQPEDNQGETGFLRIRINDNGIGISREQQDLIFDPFYTTKEPGKGTGLGLSVSLSIIESVGGRIEMESKEGQGSVLSVFLPLTA